MSVQERILSPEVIDELRKRLQQEGEVEKLKQKVLEMDEPQKEIDRLTAEVDSLEGILANCGECSEAIEEYDIFTYCYKCEVAVTEMIYFDYENRITYKGLYESQVIGIKGLNEAIARLNKKLDANGGPGDEPGD